MKKVLKKVAAALAIFMLTALSFYPDPAFAGFSYPSPVSAMNQILGDLGVDKGELRNSVATFNAGRQKKNAPQVQLNFMPSNPLPGEEITATATPVYFGNDPGLLYYTWFLKHYDPTLPNNGNRDLNRDGRIDVEDYKIEAGRIIASADFDWRNASYANDRDNDGYETPFGGDDQRGKPVHCFMHSFSTGNEYELPSCQHLFPEENIAGEDLGDGSFGIEEEQFWRTDPGNNDTAGTTRMDEANVIGLGQIEFKWNYQNGDKVGVAVEGVSFEPTQYRDSSYKTMWALPKNECPLGSFITTSNTPSGVTMNTTDNTATRTAYINDPAGIDDNDTSVTVDDGSGNSIDVSSTGWPTSGYIRIGSEIIAYSGRTATSFTGLTRGIDGTEPAVHVDDTLVTGNSVETITETTVDVRATTETTTVVTTRIETDVRDNITTIGPTTETTIENTDSFSMEINDLNDCLVLNLMSPAEGNSGEKIQPGLFYSPDAPMNDPDGINSDYLTINASVQNATNEDYLRYEWEVYRADSPNPDDWGNPLAKSQLTDSTQTSGVGAKTLRFKLSFQDPAPRYLKVRLRASEQIANGVSRSGNASIVIPVYSSANKIYVYRSRIAGNDLIGLDRSVEICRNSATDPDEQEKNAVCPVLKNEIMGLEWRPGTSQRGIRYLWTVNGEPLTYSQCFFEGCSGPNDSRANEQTNIAFLPILKDVGSTYSLELTAIRPTGEKVTMVRTFQVVNPSVKISPTDPGNPSPQPLLLGSYLDLDGRSWPDYSETDYQIVPGMTSGLSATLYPFDFPLVTDKTAWFVDGQATGDTGVNISFPAVKLVGDSYTVSFNTLYSQSAAFKNLLNKYWGVELNQFYETQLSNTINIDVVQTLPGLSAANSSQPPKKFLAAMISGLPAYLIFLFRIALTTALLLFGSWIIFSLFPNSEKNLTR